MLCPKACFRASRLYCAASASCIRGDVIDDSVKLVIQPLVATMFRVCLDFIIACFLRE